MDKKAKMSVRDLTFIGISVALIAAASQVVIPLPGGVPFTMQTLAVPLVAIVLGAKKAFIASLVYLLLGAIGVPVFAGFGAGIHRIFGPWGGFLLSYPFMVLAVGWGAESENKIELAICLLIGSFTNLGLGTFQHAMYHGGGIIASFWVAFAPFAVMEAIKMVIAFIAGLQIRKVIRKMK